MPNLSPLFGLIKEQEEQIFETINLIASENYPSENVRKAVGSVLSFKYAEGTPGNRYYGGCKTVDKIETYAQDLAKEIFDAQYANLQPHSGSAANQIAFAAFLNPGDRVMALSLDAGGHLSHGYKKNFSGSIYQFQHYSLDPKTLDINFEKLEEEAIIFQPKMIVAGASSYPKNFDLEKFSKLCKKVGAYFMFDMAHTAGFVAAKIFNNPCKYADVVTTTTHKTLKGPRGGMILSRLEHQKAIERAVMPGVQGGPAMNIIAAKAVCFEEILSNNRQDFSAYCQQVLKNAKTFSQELQDLGFELVCGTTENHIVLINITKSHVLVVDNGFDAEKKLEEVGIITNRNVIPFDTKSPLKPSGLRFGAAALTTLGADETFFKCVAQLVYQTLSGKENAETIWTQAQNLMKKLSKK